MNYNDPALIYPPNKGTLTQSVMNLFKTIPFGILYPLQKNPEVYLSILTKEDEIGYLIHHVSAFYGAITNSMDAMAGGFRFVIGLAPVIIHF